MYWHVCLYYISIIKDPTNRNAPWSSSPNVANGTESKPCTQTHHHDTYQVASYEQDWTMSAKKVIELM